MLKHEQLSPVPFTVILPHGIRPPGTILSCSSLPWRWHWDRAAVSVSTRARTPGTDLLQELDLFKWLPDQGAAGGAGLAQLRSSQHWGYLSGDQRQGFLCSWSSSWCLGKRPLEPFAAMSALPLI